MITRLTLRNFTAFKDSSLEFSPRINVIIGENGTGKTHLLKAAYGLCAASGSLNAEVDVRNDDITSSVTNMFLGLFCPIEKRLGKMRRIGVPENAEIRGTFFLEREIALSIHTNSKSFTLLENEDYERYSWKPVYIPTKEVLSLARCLAREDYDEMTINVLFDAGYLNLAKALLVPVAKNTDAKMNDDPRLNNIIPRLVNLIGGRYEWNNGVSTFQAGYYEEKPSPDRTNAKTARMYQDSTFTKFTPKPRERYSSDMTAEGFRKIGILHQLLLNDSIQPGVSGPLFWDEPESNMNPKLMKSLVQVLLELSRNGQQIILATHDYVLLKWFDLLMDKGKDDHVHFHALYRDVQSEEIKIESTDDFHEIEKNPISEAFNNLTIAHAKSRLKEAASE